MFQPGTRVYDVNTKQAGTLKTAPYVSDSAMRQVADVRWDNGELSVVFTGHIRAYADSRHGDSAQGLYGTGSHPAANQYGPADITAYDRQR